MSNHNFPMMPVNASGDPLEDGREYCQQQGMTSSGDEHTALIMPSGKGKCINFFMLPAGLGCPCNDDFTGTNGDPLSLLWFEVSSFTTSPYINDNKCRITGDALTPLIVQNECEQTGDFEIKCEVYPVDFKTGGTSDEYFDSGLEVEEYDKTSAGVSIILNYIQSPTDEWYITSFDKDFNILADITLVSAQSVVYFKIDRVNDDYTCYYKLDIGDAWITHGTVNDTTKYNYGRLQSYFDDATAIADFDNYEVIQGCNDLCFYQDTFNLPDGSNVDYDKWNEFDHAGVDQSYIYDEMYSYRPILTLGRFKYITSKGAFISDFDASIEHHLTDVTWDGFTTRFILGEFYISSSVDPRNPPGDTRLSIMFYRQKSGTTYTDYIRTKWGGWNGSVDHPTYGTILATNTLLALPTKITFRILKVGNDFTTYYKLDSDTAWTQHATINSSEEWRFIGSGANLRVNYIQYDLDNFLIEGCS